MLSGDKLGKAIGEAITKKGISKAQFARDFNVKPPSVQDWVKFGRIDKSRLEDLFTYFAGVVPSEHWGLSSLPAQELVDKLVAAAMTVSAHDTTERRRVQYRAAFNEVLSANKYGKPSNKLIEG